MNKRYYWLKLKTDFFDQKEIRMLRKIAGGDTYTIIYLKMLLSSLKDEGKLYFESIGDDFTEEIALLIDEDIENVAITIEFLKAKNLIDIIESDEFFLSRVPEMVRSEAYSTERSRRHRSIKKQQEALQCNSDATDCSVMQLRDREELEIEKEIEKELEINTLSSSEITDYLNEKAGTNYKASMKKTRSLILARSKEGFTLEDFKKAIDNKVSEWIDSPEYVKFLRPETLFGTKFEGYLNQKKVVKKNFSYERSDEELSKYDLLF